MILDDARIAFHTRAIEDPRGRAAVRASWITSVRPVAVVHRSRFGAYQAFRRAYRYARTEDVVVDREMFS